MDVDGSRDAAASVNGAERRRRLLRRPRPAARPDGSAPAAGTDDGAASGEVAELRAEVERLHRYIRDQWAAETPAGPDAPEEPGSAAERAARSRAVLTGAQEVADRMTAAARERLDEAERVLRERLDLVEEEAARRLAAADAECRARLDRAEEQAAQRLASAEAMADVVVAEARRAAADRIARARTTARETLEGALTGYEEAMARVHRRAGQAAEAAWRGYAAARGEETAAGDGDVTPGPDARAAYLRTVESATRAATTAALSRTRRDFDALITGLRQAAERPPVTPVTGLPRMIPLPAGEPAPQGT